MGFVNYPIITGMLRWFNYEFHNHIIQLDYGLATPISGGLSGPPHPKVGFPLGLLAFVGKPTLPSLGGRLFVGLRIGVILPHTLLPVLSVTVDRQLLAGGRNHHEIP